VARPFGTFNAAVEAAGFKQQRDRLKIARDALQVEEPVAA
jgi:hypothetical protein